MLDPFTNTFSILTPPNLILGVDDDDDEGWDDNSGYHSDKYDDVEDFPFELDNENIKLSKFN